MTMSLRRPGIASPALAALASRHSRFRLLARVSTPSVASEDIGIRESVVRAWLCVEASEKSVMEKLPSRKPEMK